MTSSWQEQFDTTVAEIRKIYHEAIEPVEAKFQYELFNPTWFAESLKPSKPFILFLGPFSSGKSTFINYLLGHEYLWTGPQPTTDKFTILMHGKDVQTISGPILAANNELPFRGLTEFGNQFLETFSAMQIPSDLLRSVTLIDTPGVLESAKDVHQRSYDYVRVCKYFIERADLIFVLMDPSKLDAGVELRALFKEFKGHESKLRMVLNKADQCVPQEMMRIYGSLFWSLSTLVRTTEPPRVYVSSFWNRPYTAHSAPNHQLFDEEKADLMYDVLEVIPLQSLDKRVAQVMRRANDVQIHAHIIATMVEKMPTFGKDKFLKETLANMQKIYEEVQIKYKLTAADFPPPENYVKFFDRPNVKLSDLPKISTLEKEVKKGGESILKRLDRAIRVDLPKLLHPIQQAQAIDPRRARKERQEGGETAPPNKGVYLQQIHQSQQPKQPITSAQQAAPPGPPPAGYPPQQGGPPQGYGGPSSMYPQPPGAGGPPPGQMYPTALKPGTPASQQPAGYPPQGPPPPGYGAYPPQQGAPPPQYGAYPPQGYPPQGQPPPPGQAPYYPPQQQQPPPQQPYYPYPGQPPQGAPPGQAPYGYPPQQPPPGQAPYYPPQQPYYGHPPPGDNLSGQPPATEDEKSADV